MNIIKRFFCKHEFKHVGDIYGSEIIETGYNRSRWKCVKCGKVELRPYLHGVDGN